MSQAVNRCGGCTLCCTLLKVEPLNKPAGEHCQHCVVGSGCSIWRDRPQICRGFICLWYANEQFGLDLRPDHCGVLFEPGGDRVILANVDRDRPSSWREGVAAAFIERCMQQDHAVVVQVGTTKHFLIPQGQTVDDIWRRVSDDAQRRGFV